MRYLLACALCVVVGLTGCDRVLNPILDEVVPGWQDHPRPVRADSVRGDTTYYSYQFRVDPGYEALFRDFEFWAGPDAIVAWDDGLVKIARVDGGNWLLPAFYHPLLWRPEDRIAVLFPSHFRLVCKAEDGITTPEVRSRALSVLSEAGAIILEHHESAYDEEGEPTGPDYIDICHPAAPHDDWRTPSHYGSTSWAPPIRDDVRLMQFIRALDDTATFEFFYPYTLLPFTYPGTLSVELVPDAGASAAVTALQDLGVPVIGEPYHVVKRWWVFKVEPRANLPLVVWLAKQSPLVSRLHTDWLVPVPPEWASKIGEAPPTTSSPASLPDTR